MDFFVPREPVSTWTHAAGLLLALPGTLLLLRRAAGDRPRQLGLLVYGLSLALCYGASALFHGARVDARRLNILYLLDRIGIFTLIAGTYTPIALNLLRGAWRSVTLSLAWLAAAGGIGLNLALGGLSPGLCTALYLGMGWGAVLSYARIAEQTSYRAVRPILVGGAFYSVGAVLNLLRWPNPWPGAFGYHEVFHLFVIAGSLSHYAFILAVAAPPRPARAVPSRPHPVRTRRTLHSKYLD